MNVVHALPWESVTALRGFTEDASGPVGPTANTTVAPGAPAPSLTVTQTVPALWPATVEIGLEGPDNTTVLDAGNRAATWKVVAREPIVAATVCPLRAAPSVQAT